MRRTCLIVARIKKNLSQKEIAMQLGIAQQSYAKYEEGKATPKTFKIINQLSEILGKEKTCLFPDIFNKKCDCKCGGQ